MTIERYRMAGFGGAGLAYVSHQQPTEYVVLFVHGWGGGPGTWGRFPQFVFESSSLPLDVALFRYRSGVRRWSQKGRPVSDYADQLRAEIQTLSQRYKGIFIVGHSMGGLLAQWATWRFMAFADRPPGHTPVAGIFLIASASYGSPHWAFPKSDRTILKRGSQPQVDVHHWFESMVERQNRAVAGNRRWVIPVECIPAMRDHVVQRASAELGLPLENVLPPIDGNHRSLKRPKTADSRIVEVLIRRMRAVIDTRQNAPRSGAAPSQITKGAQSPRSFALITDFRGPEFSPMGLAAYKAASQHYDYSVPVMDANAKTDADAALGDLRLVATDAEAVLGQSASARADVDWAVSVAIQRPTNTGGVAVVGDEASAAAQTVTSAWVPVIPYRNLLVDGVDDERELRHLFRRWISYAADLAAARTESQLSQLTVASEWGMDS